jgi:hypothetical protein
MRIDSVLPNRASPGQSVIIQGDGLEAAEKVLFGDQESLLKSMATHWWRKSLTARALSK